MSQESFHTTVVNLFGLPPTEHQQELLQQLETFIRKKDGKNLFVLTGYAGTGKTSVLGAFVKALNHYKVKTKLLAPTGRAAKVFSHKSNQEAGTIHKHIYRRKSKVEITAGLSLQKNLFKNTVFFVDEASMIGDYTMTKDGGVSARNLLEDLIEYVFTGENCKLILIGDAGQLPPVGSDFSPALSLEYLENHFSDVSLYSYHLVEVLRQAEDSEVLRNATLLRNTAWIDYPKFQLKKGTDLVRISGLELQDELESSFGNFGQEETILITRSNKQANQYNQHIRARILWYEELLCSGDCLMVVKNNYFWLGDDTKIGFIANGELIKIVRVRKVEEMHGFEFAHVIVRFVDYEDLGDVELIIHTESLTVEGPSLSRERMKELFYSVERDYAHFRNKKERYDAILADKYFNALQVKYAYAVTCHKSQGGQWSDVYIDQGFINEEILGQDYYRWLYTALTRATNKVYLVNFKDEFFE
ncbi:MAG TPA: ATP-dependent endonuclease [Crocinitomicaceae bacterium]|nr:ATP-dependent endonuclease [Crocinitomicaceae bacterium]